MLKHDTLHANKPFKINNMKNLILWVTVLIAILATCALVFSSTLWTVVAFASFVVVSLFSGFTLKKMMKENDYLNKSCIFVPEPDKTEVQGFLKKLNTARQSFLLATEGRNLAVSVYEGKIKEKNLLVTRLDTLNAEIVSSGTALEEAKEKYSSCENRYGLLKSRLH